MIDEKQLQDGLKRLLKQTEDDIRERLKEEPDLVASLKTQHQAAVDAGRSDAKGFREFRDDSITQAAVHWLLACVFIRFLEDNELIDEAWIAGVGKRLEEALDRRRLFYRENPRANDRDYLLHVFEQVGKLPDMADLFHRDHNPLWRLGPTGPQAMKILQFFQERDESSGSLFHDFTDPEWGTRFLGDLYQNLSEHARKRYALCQTPDFVIDFILDRTLTPALDVFGLEETRLIDPTCGSGHFLLAAFDRLYRQWQKREPSESPQTLAQRVLDNVYGVDLNPFAVEIARFRLLVAALRTCSVKKLRNAPDFRFQLATGDSLLHGPPLKGEGMIQRHIETDPIEHFFQTEDAAALRRMLGQQYHAVVGNPPYINVKDAALREKYRERYGSCHGKYQLGVPFTERFFRLAVLMDGDEGRAAGFVGMIVSNAFMKRSFGKKLVEEYLPHWDLTHVIDTSGVYLPGHGTPTAILLGRHQSPLQRQVRAIRGIRGETGVPNDPATAAVWSAITAQVDEPGSESLWVSSVDAPRDFFHSHPWAIGGGGAAELKAKLDESGTSSLESVADNGVQFVTLEDDVFLRPGTSFLRSGLTEVVPFASGEALREWSIDSNEAALFPYDQSLEPRLSHEAQTSLWPYRTGLLNRIYFGQRQFERDLNWWEYGVVIEKRFGGPSIAYGEVATHNHFVLCGQERVFNQTSPVVKLPAGTGLRDRFGLLGLLNSSTACFWLKQVCFPKGGDHVGTEGARVTKVQWEERYAFDSTKLKQFPLPRSRPLKATEEIQREAGARTALLPQQLRTSGVPGRDSLVSAKVEAQAHLQRMIALQEEIDWQVYHSYGLLDEDLSLSPDDLPPLNLGERSFEILMARQMALGELETTWFERHDSTPITEIPSHWPEEYRAAVAKRIETIESDRDIGLIEQPEYKRRWNLPSWDELEKEALQNWLLDWMESESLWSQPEFKTCARLADTVRRDSDFLQVAELYCGRPDFDFVKLVTDLVLKQAVPFLPVLRYKPSGLEKRRQWEEAWELQRREDAGEKVEIPVPPKYRSSDFLPGPYWGLRGGLDVPKERFILYPYLERDSDSTPVLGWAGWDHLQQAQALATYYQYVKEEEGWTAERLTPVLAGLLELIPWLKQWHNDVDETTGERLGDVFEAFLETERQALNLSLDSLREWAPPKKATTRRRRKAS